MNIGGIDIRNNLILAPMAGYTDVGFRKICAEFGAGLTVTEMVSAKGLCFGSDGSRDLLATTDAESVKVVQLFGAEPEFIYRAVGLPELEKFDIIDINMGCPVAKIVKNGEGSALLKDNGLIEEIIRAAIEGGKRPVTAKIRLGLEDNEFTAVDNAHAIERAGGAAVAVHGRTRSQFYSGDADYNRIAEVKKAVKIPIILSGDIVDKRSLERAQKITLCDGYMIGRGALGKPYIFSELQDKECIFDIKNIILEHIEELLKILPDKVVANNMKKHICYYGINCGHKKQLRADVNNAVGLKQIVAVVDKYF